MTERIFRAFHVPSDERAMTSVYTESLPLLLRRCSIEFMEVVRGRAMDSHNCVMVMDDEAIRRNFPVNRRAQFLSGYPIEHAIRGDVLFFTEGGNPYTGYDLGNISEKALTDYLENDAVHEGYSRWLASPLGRDYSLANGFLAPRPFNPGRPKVKKCPGHAPGGGAGSEEPSEPDFCDGSCITTN
jgi:hypothetical protein